jgi:hypothetical protein
VTSISKLDVFFPVGISAKNEEGTRGDRASKDAVKKSNHFNKVISPP